MNTVLLVLCIVSALWWTWNAYAIVRTMHRVPRHFDPSIPAPSQWPRVSLVIAARNEERELERAVRSRLADDYPNLQLVLVDDRSTDATPAIADRLASEDARVHVVHVTELPRGWLGKLHAMYRGVEVADGAWLLFSDADVEFAPGTIRHAIARCEHQGIDHLAVIPTFREHGALIDATMQVFGQIIVVGARLWSVPDANSRAAVGGGMFNLVRRTAYDKTPGLEWLRLEIADDVVFGQMLKRNGARAAVTNAGGWVRLDFYRTLGEMAAGLEKSGFAVVGRFNMVLLLLLCVLFLALELGCFVAIAHPSPELRLVAVTTSFVAIASSAALAHWIGRSPRVALLVPFGAVAMVVMMVRSGVLAHRRGGISWRDTLYSIDELRTGSRFAP